MFRVIYSQCVNRFRKDIFSYESLPRLKLRKIQMNLLNSVAIFPRMLATSTNLRNNYKVLYDGECSLCQKEIRVLKWLTDKNKNQVDFVDIAAEDYEASSNSGVTYEMAMKEMHVIDPQGEVHSKSEAIRQMYEAVGLSWVARLTRLPGLESATDKMYDVFAEYRLKKAFRSCDDGHCSVKVKQLRDKLSSESKK